MSRLVMVIDDSPTVRKILEVFLKIQEIDTVSYSDGVEALRALKAQPDLIPALIFLDVCLPILDGYEVARLLRTDPRFASTVIIMLSRRDSIVDRLKGRLAGASAYMTKPFMTQDILFVVSRYLPLEGREQQERSVELHRAYVS